MGYSSVAHLSSQFKKVTGLSLHTLKSKRQKTKSIEEIGTQNNRNKLSFKNAMKLISEKDFNFIIYIGSDYIDYCFRVFYYNNLKVKSATLQSMRRRSCAKNDNVL
jgi:D-arabinose 1-dehydrogenase-like Zn-dependent alcohol dehydrogenase